MLALETQRDLANPNLRQKIPIYVDIEEMPLNSNILGYNRTAQRSPYNPLRVGQTAPQEQSRRIVEIPQPIRDILHRTDELIEGQKCPN